MPTTTLASPRLATALLVLALVLPGSSLAQTADAVPEGEKTPTTEADDAPKPTKGESLEAEITAILEQRDQQRALLEDATGNDRAALEQQEWETQLSFHRKLMELAKEVVADPEGADAHAYRNRLIEVFERKSGGYLRVRSQREKAAAALRAEIEEAPLEDQLPLEQAVSEIEGKLQKIFLVELEGLDAMDTLGMDTSRRRLGYLAELRDRAETLAGRLRVATASQANIADQIAAAPDSPELKAQDGAIRQRLDRAKSHLSDCIRLLEQLGIDTAQYQQLLIESTGEITVDVFNPEVAAGLIDKWVQEARSVLVRRGPAWLAKLTIVLLVLLGFRVAASLTRRIVARSVRSSRVNVSQLLQQTLVSWSSRSVMLIGLLVAISQVGIEIGPLLAGLGIAGFVIGFALQDSLSNFAAGAMILMYRPFDVGDIIEAAGVSGQVREMSLVSTTVHTFDNQTLIIPNTKLWGDVIRNVTAQKTRRVDLTVMVGYAEDVDRVDAVLRDLVTADERVLAEPAPMIEVHQLADSGVEFIVRPWVHTEDYWGVYWGLTREIKRRFDREGIHIPFPQRDIHHHYDAGGPPP